MARPKKKTLTAAETKKQEEKAVEEKETSEPETTEDGEEIHYPDELEKDEEETSPEENSDKEPELTEAEQKKASLKVLQEKQAARRNTTKAALKEVHITCMKEDDRKVTRISRKIVVGSNRISFTFPTRMKQGETVLLPPIAIGYLENATFQEQVSSGLEKDSDKPVYENSPRFIVREAKDSKK